VLQGIAVLLTRYLLQHRTLARQAHQSVLQQPIEGFSALQNVFTALVAKLVL
jgi:hypothetical protein